LKNSINKNQFGWKNQNKLLNNNTQTSTKV
jgi:hypothetical protein